MHHAAGDRFHCHAQHFQRDKMLPPLSVGVMLRHRPAASVVFIASDGENLAATFSPAVQRGLSVKSTPA